MAHVHQQKRPLQHHSAPATWSNSIDTTSVRAPTDHAASVEAFDVTVSWGDYVVAVAHHQPPRAVSIGEALSDGRPCDILLPKERLGFDSLPLIEVRGQAVLVLLPASAEGFLRDGAGAMTSIERLRLESEAHALVPGAHLYALRHLECIELRLGTFHIVVRATTRAVRPSRTLASSFDSRFLGSLALTVLSVGAWFGALAYYVPNMNLALDDELNDEQIQTIRHFLSATSEPNLDQREASDNSAGASSERNGQSGTRSPGESGKTGSTVSRHTRGRMALQGPADNRDVHLGKAEALEQARNFGMVELLGTLNSQQASALNSPFGSGTALGRDAVNAIGQLYGESIGDSAGFGGLSLSGTGQGGGCVGPHCGAGIGLGDVGTIGGGTGTCDGDGPCDGMGRGHGLGRGRGHVTKAPRVRMPPSLSISGRLPPEVIQRIVRQNYGRFRFCYEQGLARNPNLEGRVVTRFVIGRDGAVSNAQNGGSDLPDAEVQSCILRSFYGLSFPAPEGGVVSVSYPIQLQPG